MRRVVDTPSNRGGVVCKTLSYDVKRIKSSRIRELNSAKKQQSYNSILAMLWGWGVGLSDDVFKKVFKCSNFDRQNIRVNANAVWMFLFPVT